jgi:hypothetical protein
LPTALRIALVVAVLAATVGAATTWLHHRLTAFEVDDSQVHFFSGVSGPETDAAVAAPGDALARYSTGSSSRLAVLLTDADSAWLGLAHGLKSIGVPFVITRDYRVALRHKVVFVYPYLSGKALPPEGLRAIARFPRDGGTLIAQNVLGGDLNEVFGFGEAVPTTRSTRMEFNTGVSVAAEFTEPEERVIRIGADGDGGDLRGAYAYTEPRNPPLAVYGDRTAAITHKPYAAGRAYAFGIDVGYLILKGHNTRQELRIATHYANSYEPTLDVLLRCLRNIYLEGEPGAVTLGTVPHGKSLSVVLTHDIDYSRSVRNAVDYAESERRAGVDATYFVQTKYVRDWNDDAFFNDEGLPRLRRLKALGMELASHSVSHSAVFADFPLGRGDERYPGYRPFVKERKLAYNGTVLGEVRVSRFLLDRLVPGQSTVSFRPGHLQNPTQLPEALAAAGYRYSSTLTANLALTHLPFQLNHSRGARAEVAVYEFPIAIEDELAPPVLQRLPQAIELARKLSRYGGSYVVLIHPDTTGPKLEFQERLVEALRGPGWFGSLEKFGAWWAARDRTELDTTADGRRRTVRVRTPEPVAGLTLLIAPGARLVSQRPADAGVVQDGERLVIAKAVPDLTLELELSR